MGTQTDIWPDSHWVHRPWALPSLPRPLLFLLYPLPTPGWCYHPPLPAGLAAQSPQLSPSLDVLQASPKVMASFGRRPTPATGHCKGISLATSAIHNSAGHSNFRARCKINWGFWCDCIAGQCPKSNPQKGYCTGVSDSKSVSQRTQPHKDIFALFKLESTMPHAFPSLSLRLQSVPILQQSPTLPSKSPWVLNLDSDPNSAIYLLGPLGNYLTSLVQLPIYKWINEDKGSYSYSS